MQALGAAGLKRDEPYQQKDAGAVDLTPWKPAPYVGLALALFALTVYLVFAF